MHAEDSSGRAAGGPGVVGVIVQLGGQTPLGLARRLKAAGVPIVGTSPESIHLAEDRGAFGKLLAEAGLLAPAHGTATSFDEAKAIADEIGYPVLVRPSYVLGGRGMEIVYDDATLRDYIGRATDISPEHPVLVDRFLDDAIEIDVDALVRRDRRGVPRRHHGAHRGGRHPLRRLGLRAAADHAGRGRRGQGPRLHRGDRPRHRRARAAQRAVRPQGRRALRARGQPARLAHRAVRLQGDRGAAGQGGRPDHARRHHRRAARRGHAAGRPATAASCPPDAPIAVKEAVLPFKRFRTAEGRGVDSLLGPEMKSTGEVMGIDTAFGHAFAKSQAAAYGSLPTSGKIFVTVANRDKRGMIFPVKRLADLGFEIVATAGTGEVLRRHGVACEIVRKHFEAGAGGRDAVSLIAAGEVALVINTPQGSGARMDGYEIRSAAVAADIPCITTVPGAAAAVMGIEALIRGEMTVRPLQELHAALRPRAALRRLTVLERRWPAPALFRLAAGTPRRRTSGPAPARRPGRRAAGRSAALRRALAAVRAPREVFGVRFPNPVGLAAGMDKDGVALPAWPALGSASSRSARSPGTPSRATSGPGCSGCAAREAVINRMGFNNAGAAGAGRRGWRRVRRRCGVPLGISLGKSKVTAAGRRRRRTTWPRCACSTRTGTTSPSTSARRTRPGLRSLQDRGHLDRLLGVLEAALAAADSAASRCWSRSRRT